MQRATDLNLTPVQFNRIQDFTQEAWTQEFRLHSKDKNSDWNWQAGLFYSNIDKSGVSDTVIFNATNCSNTPKLNFENYAGKVAPFVSDGYFARGRMALDRQNVF